MKRFSRFLLFVALLAVAGGSLWWWAKTYYFKVDPLAGVITTRAVKGDIEEAVLATGTLRPIKLVAVGAQVSGRITALKVAVGQQVKKGDLIAEIDSLTQQNALKTAEAFLASVGAQLDEKQATLAYAQSALKREQITLTQHASSRDTYESAETTVKTTEAQIAALNAQIVEAEVAVETARVNLGYTRITAPMDGTVLLTMAEEGQTVNATQSAPTIVILGEIDRMEVRAEISEADVTKVKPGQNVYFTVLGDLTHQFEGKLETIDPAPDSLRSDSAIATTTSTVSSSSSSSATSAAIYYYGRFTIPNPDGLLKTYMTAEVHIVLGSAKGVVTVPTSALSAEGPDGKRTIDVVEPTGVISTRAVEVGLNDKLKAEIRSGLKAGERIVSSRKSASFVKTNMFGGPSPRGL
jgi:macrolide-specific efflux system membrane fusion protein